MKTPKKPVPLMPEKNPMKAAFDLMPKTKKPEAKPVKAPKAPKVAKAPARPTKGASVLSKINPKKKGF